MLCLSLAKLCPTEFHLHHRGALMRPSKAEIHWNGRLKREGLDPDAGKILRGKSERSWQRRCATWRQRRDANEKREERDRKSWRSYVEQALSPEALAADAAVRRARAQHQANTRQLRREQSSAR